MPKLDPETFRTMPWKNGGGTTIEALTLPPGADLDTFELRVSMAHVEVAGPFSRFLGIDRTLVVMDGEGMTLRMADGSAMTLGQGSAPFTFAGDDPVHATLSAGAIRDFNVMTRRSVLRHHARRIAVDGELRFACAGVLSMILVLNGDATASDGAEETPLHRGDLFTVAQRDALVILRSAPHAELLRVDVFRHS
jgi:hypothetical protein